MGVTYTTAAERDTRHVRTVAAANVFDLRLAAASLVALVLIGAAGAGRFARVPFPAHAVDLNRVTDARTLEPVVAAVFTSDGDRRLATQELFAFLIRRDAGEAGLPNVGALSRARVSLARIAANRDAVEYRARAADERARAAASKRAAADAIPLFTAAQLAQLKPLLTVRDRSGLLMPLVLWGALYVLAFHAVSAAWRVRGIRGDHVLLVIAHVLTGIGFAAMVSRPDPYRDLLLFVRYAQGICLGLAFAAAIALIDARKRPLHHFSLLPLAGAVALSIVLILFGSGPSGSNAKVNLGPVQPIEAIRLLLALFLAAYFARHWEVLRVVREESVGGVAVPRWVHVPRARHVAPVLIGVGGALLLFFFQRDLGPALMLSVVFLATWSIATGRSGVAIAGFAFLIVGFYVGYRLEISSTLAARVLIWQAPWDNAARGGDQVAHALWAAATGGPAGSGLGLGDPRYVPAGETDLVLASIAEELGIVGMAAIAVLFLALIWRSMNTASRAATDYGFFLSVVLALFFAVPVLLVGAGILGLIPLTGVVTPFLSFGGSAMVANFAAIGLLAAIRSERRDGVDVTPFRAALRWVNGSLALATLVLLTTVAFVQVVNADDIAVRPHLGLQADGGRRYQYNPRVLDAARVIPRGSILDRNGLALASDDAALLGRTMEAYTKAGVAAGACPQAGARCYPLGGRTYHVLGDANTRTNWSATNTSFVERDSEARLRGFDDRQVVVQPTGSNDTATLRRDYTGLLPMVRHRHDRNHPAVKTMLERPRDVRITIDARLQARVAAILAQSAGRSHSGHAAAVVLDPATGNVLASVSYPWPDDPDASRTIDRDALLDRPRYGLYPPGSTFKIVTAAAALLKDADAAERTFVCSRLDDGRVGARISGWSRPIRDDVLDRTPHGTVNMHRGLVVSCNAYFAQLAASIGPSALVAAADRGGLSVAAGNATARVRDTLPQAGYGQGDVVASPLKMARIAAAIAADGTIREARIDSAAATATGHEFLPREAARQIGRFMRDVVNQGTGRSVAGAAVPIAGKTGTAEVTGAPSHAWFVGFAPYGSATSRVAVAVIVENAGYGGTAAAPIAGEIINAAAALGFAR